MNNNYEDDPLDLPSYGKEGFSCSKYAYISQSKFNTQRHESKCKKDLPQEPKCHICDKVFPSKFNFKRHLQTNDKDEESEECFPCHLCTKKFKYDKNRKRHIRLQHQETVKVESSIGFGTFCKEAEKSSLKQKKIIEQWANNQ